MHITQVEISHWILSSNSSDMVKIILFLFLPCIRLFRSQKLNIGVHIQAALCLYTQYKQYW